MPQEVALLARIRDTAGRRNPNSGYVRLLGNERLGLLLSRMHATTIRAGNELEKILERHCAIHSEGLTRRVKSPETPRQLTKEVFFNETIHTDGNGKGTRFDVVVLNHEARTATVVELKDGDTFDTKKANGELASVTRVAEYLGRVLDYDASHRFCSFNQEDKALIVAGVKGRFSAEHVMTGREFCRLIEVDFEAVLEERRGDVQDNFDYFVAEMMAIPEVARHAAIAALPADQTEEGCSEA